MLASYQADAAPGGNYAYSVLGGIVCLGLFRVIVAIKIVALYWDVCLHGD